MYKKNKSVKELRSLFDSLKQERLTYEKSWKDVCKYTAPSREKFLKSDYNDGQKKDQSIINNTARMASQTYSAGLMSHVTNPSRQWFNLSTDNEQLNELPDVAQWLFDVKSKMTEVFNRSNLYRELPIHYSDLADFGTAVLLIEEDDDKVVDFQTLPPGSYYLFNDDKNKTQGFCREVSFTTFEIYTKFVLKSDGSEDWESVSEAVKDAFDNGNKMRRFDVMHYILKNEEYNPESSLAKFKKYRSCYYEVGDKENFLGESGYDDFPVCATRYKYSVGDVYGHDSPGLVSDSDNKSLQFYETKLLETVEKKVSPALLVHSSLRSEPTSTLPNSVIYYDENAGREPVRTAHEINFNTSELRDLILKAENKINRAYHVDLFLMLTNDDRRQITATEIIERKQEKLLALGPVLEQINQDLLDPLIDVTFNIMYRKGLIPEPPMELQSNVDTKLKVDYVSVMNQAQKQSELSSINPIIELVSNLSQIDPGVLDKFNAQKVVSEYAQKLAIPPGIIRSDDEVQEIEDQRNEARQAQMERENQIKNTEINKNLSETKLDPNNALTQLIQAQQEAANV